MLFSRASQYAVQALIYLATQRRDRFVLRREITDNLRIPTDYLGKVMGTMGRVKLLRSLRGRKGDTCWISAQKGATCCRFRC